MSKEKKIPGEQRQRYHFYTPQHSVRVSVCAHTETNARASLSIVIRGYSAEDWILDEKAIRREPRD